LARLYSNDIGAKTLNTDTKSYICKHCGEMVEYTYPCKIEYIDEYPFKIIIPIDKAHYKATARYNHNRTHKGALDVYGFVV